MKSYKASKTVKGKIMPDHVDYIKEFCFIPKCNGLLKVFTGTVRTARTNLSFKEVILCALYRKAWQGWRVELRNHLRDYCSIPGVR